MYEVLVNELELVGHHGVTEEERAQGCKLKISISAVVDGSADTSDSITDTVDYGELAALMVETSSSASYITLEKLARVFADLALARFPAVQSLVVHIDKHNPPVPFDVDSLGVRLTLSRHG